MKKSNTTDVLPGGGSDKNEKATGENNTVKEIISWIEVIAAAVVIALVLNSFIILNVTVPSGSMENTIQKGNRLFGLRLTYMFSEPQRGDIAVFYYPVDAALGKKKRYIKRIIGLPGEKVVIRDSKVYITPADGSDEFELDEPYLKDPGDSWTVMNGSSDPIEFEVPEGCYLMLGDNRNNSSDARYWAALAVEKFTEAGKEITMEEALSLQYVKKDQILGKAYFRYWPLTQISSLY